MIYMQVYLYLCTYKQFWSPLFVPLIFLYILYIFRNKLNRTQPVLPEYFNRLTEVIQPKK